MWAKRDLKTGGNATKVDEELLSALHKFTYAHT